MILRRRHYTAVQKYLVAAVIGSLVYCEWLVYRLQPLSWLPLDCSPDDVTCVRVLFVADPQIQGVLADPFPLNYIFMWDSDRYLKSTYLEVHKYFKPDVVVYLGDLMDEGSVSTMERFRIDADRLFDIFNFGADKYLALPGDNDIGGENEPIRLNKLEEFRKVFQSPQDLLAREGLAFLVVNGITHTIPNVSAEALDSFRLRVVVSHYSTTSKGMFAREVHKRLRPHLYVCAHSHESKYVRHTQEFRDREVRRRDFGKEPLKVTFSNDSMLYEVYVPTCSYRMGTGDIGFGAAVIENNYQQLRYAVFWSPRRFLYLSVYLCIGVSVLLVCVYTLLLKIIGSTKSATRVRSERMALIKNIA